MKILVYEDPKHTDLYPLNLLRASFDIKCGANTLLERITGILNRKFEISLYCRQSIEPYLKEIHDNKINFITDDDYLFLNGKVVFTDELMKILLSYKEDNTYFTCNDLVVAAYFNRSRVGIFRDRINKQHEGNLFGKEMFELIKADKIELNPVSPVHIITYPWDVIKHIVKGGLEDDLKYFLRANKKFTSRKTGSKSKGIFTGKKVAIHPQVILDSSEGTIVIDDNAKIEPFTFIKGPVYIGKNVLIKSGARIYGPCVIGEYSKVAGETAESIFHSYVNKQHDGFIGHSYVCPFVNFGADTVTSDLKNNYSTVRIRRNGEDIDTGMQLLGTIAGDHSKTSINTMLNTGSVIGIFANLFGGGFHPKEIGSFSWNESGKPSVKYDVVKAIATARIVMGRRRIMMSEEYEKMVLSTLKK